MRRLIFLMPLLLGILAVRASSQTTPDVNLAGLYICDGVNPDGHPYAGFVVITKQNDSYELLWWLNSELAAIGLGIRSGNVLAVMHYSGTPGVTAYEIEQGPRLVGRWTVPGAEGVLFTETLTRAPDDMHVPAVPSPHQHEPQHHDEPRASPREFVIAWSPP